LADVYKRVIASTIVVLWLIKFVEFVIMLM